jgi:pimeloyl-ACP methyl ester carboxylesterase
MKHHRVTGGGGIRLHLVETGNSSGPPIVFIHGFSQCSLAWTRQMSSELADTFRLVAMDMRGRRPLLWPADRHRETRFRW